MQTKQQTWVVTLTVIAVIAIVALIVFKPFAQEDKDQAQDGDLPEENGGSTQNFTFSMPEDWKYFTNANEDIQAITPNQSIMFGIVDDPTQDNVAYFSSIATDPADENKQLMSVYKYSTADYTFERIYKKSFAAGDIDGIREGATYAFHAVGYDQGKLVILAQDLDDSPGPCTVVYTLGRESDDIAREMMSLDLLNPFTKGLQPYRVPDDIYQAAVESENTCVPPQPPQP